MGLLDGIFRPIQHQQQAHDKRRAEIYRSLIHWQAGVGGKLFGPIPEGNRREFFCLDEQTWVWHEEWNDNEGQHALTTRYDIRPSGILKSQGTAEYQAISREEAKNLYNAMTLYYQQVMPELDRLRQLNK